MEASPLADQTLNEHDKLVLADRQIRVTECIDLSPDTNQTIDVPYTVIAYYAVQRIYSANLYMSPVIVLKIRGNVVLMPRYSSSECAAIDSHTQLDNFAEILLYFEKVVSHYGYIDPIYFVDSTKGGVVCNEGIGLTEFSRTTDFDVLMRIFNQCKEKDPAHEQIDVTVPSGKAYWYPEIAQLTPIHKVIDITERFRFPPRTARPTVNAISRVGIVAEGISYWETMGIDVAIENLPKVGKKLRYRKGFSGPDRQRAIAFIWTVINEQFGTMAFESIFVGSEEYLIVYEDRESLLLIKQSYLISKVRWGIMNIGTTHGMKKTFSRMKADNPGETPTIVVLGTSGMYYFSNEWWLPSIQRFLAMRNTDSVAV